MKRSKGGTNVPKPPPGYFKTVVAKFVSSIKEHFKEIEEASAELKQQAVTGVIGIEASKDCWEKICKDNARLIEENQEKSKHENEDKSFFWKGKVQDAEKYAQLPLCPKLT